jgi:hypothetical protein
MLLSLKGQTMCLITMGIDGGKTHLASTYLPLSNQGVARSGYDTPPARTINHKECGLKPCPAVHLIINYKAALLERNGEGETISRERKMRR